MEGAEQLPHNDAEIVARIAYSDIYKALGLGVDPFGFGRRFLALSRSDPSTADRLNAVAHRLLFVDFLVEEASRLLHVQSDTSRDATSLHENIDSLEVFLLCTCIDTLAGGGRWEEFPAWLRSHVLELQGGSNSSRYPLPGSDEYLAIVAEDYTQYRLSSGLTGAFAQFFLSLPPSTMVFIANSINMVRGPFWDQDFQSRVAEWQSRTVEDRLNRLARTFFYEIRSQYAHASRVHPVSSPSLLHRLREAQGQAISEQGWKLLLVYAHERSDTVQMTLAIRSHVSESTLLRLALYSHALKTLAFPVDHAHHEHLLASIAAKDAIQRAILEIERNQVIQLTLHRFMFPYLQGDTEHSNPPLLATVATSRLIDAYSDFIGLLVADLRGYLNVASTINDAVSKFSRTPQVPDGTRAHTAPLKSVLDDAQVSHAYLILDHYHQNLSFNLRYHIHSGQINFQHGTITDFPAA